MTVGARAYFCASPTINDSTTVTSGTTQRFALTRLLVHTAVFSALENAMNAAVKATATTATRMICQSFGTRELPSAAVGSITPRRVLVGRYAHRRHKSVGGSRLV